MTEIFSFPPVVSSDAKVLILGSMPGIKSLQQCQYYAHPQNSFWFIIERLFAIDKTQAYTQRIKLLQHKKIAVWDVLKACRREGSLDSAIEQGSVVANDFVFFLEKYSDIEFVFFNGAKAEQEYKKHVMADLSVISRQINYLHLPSTSPAHAAMSREGKLGQWQSVKQCLLNKNR